MDIKENVYKSISSKYPNIVKSTFEQLYKDPETVMMYYMKMVLPPAFLREIVKHECKISDNDKFLVYLNEVKSKFPTHWSDYDLKFRLQEHYENYCLPKNELNKNQSEKVIELEPSKKFQEIKFTIGDEKRINLRELNDIQKLLGKSVYFELRKDTEVYKLFAKGEHREFGSNFFLDPSHESELLKDFHDLPKTVSGTVKEITAKKLKNYFKYSLQDGSTVVLIKLNPY